MASTRSRWSTRSRYIPKTHQVEHQDTPLHSVTHQVALLVVASVLLKRQLLDFIAAAHRKRIEPEDYTVWVRDLPRAADVETLDRQREVRSN